MQFFRRHPALSLLAVALAITLSITLISALRAERRVKVQTGTRTMCTYGEVLASNVRTLWVPESDAGKYRVTTRTVLCEKHRLAQKYYQQGQALAAKKKYAAALNSFKQAARYDAHYKGVATWIATGGKSGGKGTGAGGPSATGTNGGTGTGPSDGGAPPSSLTSLIPAKLSGYVAGTLSGQSDYAERSFAPARPGAVTLLIIRVYRPKTAAQADRFIDRVSKRAYPQNSRLVRFRGTQAYFGVRRPASATYAWTKSGTVRELLMESSNRRPQDLYAPISDIASRVQ